MDISGFIAPMKELGWTAVTWGLVSFGGFVVLASLILVAIYTHKRKKWNLRVETKLPRSDGKIVMSEAAKGHYNLKQGVVDIKRKGMKPVGMRPFDIRKYLQGEKYLEVIQLGADEYVPILPKSYEVIQENPSGEKKALLEIEADLSKRRTWKNYFERVAKERFTLEGFLQKYGQMMALGIIIFIIFLGFSILWMRMPSICG